MRIQEVRHSINGAFIDEITHKRLIVGWNRNKDENSVKHEVRYSFQNIHDIGWNQALIAPNSPISPQGYQGYNTILYETDQIETTNREIYVAVKPENSDNFKQIHLKLQNLLGKSTAIPPTLHIRHLK